MREYNKVVKSAIISMFIMAVFYVLKIVNFSELVNVKNSSVCWNIITINSVFAGFMFTSLSMLISVISTDTVRRLERASLMDEIYINILCGIYCGLASIGIALSVIFILPNVITYVNSKNQNLIAINVLIYDIIPFLMIYTLILSILCFLGSVLDVRFIIADLRKKINKGSISEERKNKVLEKIR